ncbi:major histocompatibility complex class I-related gene protein-like isoform X2 [Dunckerocampus dactyliophorus]|uniref:major histocompatibility complex class I-related gene protein-like isoform X2 n=1 Tax=Dunckerocampus dactyliophorus TaxID=161453 RepID=UPI00240717E4|nr:major histocompatibility complex class I-related gene protein-like isoform X2 [Dunckerocampus dactyliophorus]
MGEVKILLLLLCCHVASPVTHYLWHVYTVTTGIANLPGTVAVVVVDGIPTVHYDSLTNTAVPEEAWMNSITQFEPDYWKKQTSFWEGQDHYGRINIDILRKRFNHTQGVHVFQVLHGCEYDDQTGVPSGFNYHSYDGDDTLFLDVKERRWISLKPQMDDTQRKWNDNTGWMEFMEHRLLKECPQLLNNTLECGKSVLQRIERPMVSLLQTSPSAVVTCHATGFYPDIADMFWSRDGKQIYEHVEHGELLPNHDHTFQLSVTLDVNALPPHDWQRYACVFRLSGLQEDIVVPLDASKIMTNYVKPHNIAIPVGTLVAGIVAAVAVAIGIYVCKKRRDHKAERGSDEDVGWRRCKDADPEDTP